MKYCAKCGNANADEAVFCASCGSPLEQAPAAPEAAPAPESAPELVPESAPEPSAYSAPTYDATPAAPAEKNTATLWLILNIVLTVLCCGNLFGIIGIIFAAIGMGSHGKGNYEDMKKKAKISMIMFIVGIVLGIISIIVAIATGLLASISDLGSLDLY